VKSLSPARLWHNKGMNKKRTKLNWALLAGLALVCVCLFQLPALQAMSSPYSDTVDIMPMRAGYEVAQTQGTLHWWCGRWINESSNYFRPLSSYFHFAQFYLLDRMGFQAVTLATIFCYSLLCFLTGILSYQLSRSCVAACVAVVVASLAAPDRSMTWLAYFPFMDGILSALFQIATLTAFVAYCQSRQRGLLLTSWGCFLASTLSKEPGAFTPVILMVLCLGSKNLALPRKVIFAHLTMMLLAGIALLKYGRIVTGKSGHLVPVRGFWVSQLNADGIWLVAAALIILIAIVCLVYYRGYLDTPMRRITALSLILCALMGCAVLAPPHGLPRVEYALVYLVDNFASMIRDSFFWMTFLGILLTTLSKRHPLLTICLCGYMATYPFVVSSTAITGGRIVFMVPFIAIITAFGVLQVTYLTQGTVQCLVLYPKSHAANKISSAEGCVSDASAGTDSPPTRVLASASVPVALGVFTSPADIGK
jgi:hypothetical protein